MALARSISAVSVGSHEDKMGSTVSLNRQHAGPLLSKLESIASSAVRAADKVGASLIIVYTQSGEAIFIIFKVHMFLGYALMRTSCNEQDSRLMLATAKLGGVRRFLKCKVLHAHALLVMSSGSKR